MSIKTPTDVLKAAKQLIQQQGWVRGSYRRGRGYCPLGAILAVIGVDATEGDSMADWANELLINALPAGFSRVWEFNDEPGRTVEEIYELFDRAIARTLTGVR